MASSQNKLEIAKRIRSTLERFVEEDERGQIQVYETAAGNLRAVIGSRKFKGCGPAMRQEIVWDFLRANGDAEDLVHLIGVDPKDPDEYATDEFRRMSSASVDFYINGRDSQS
jgi:stress-induced morphogen